MKGDTTLTLEEAVTEWKPGDVVVLTATDVEYGLWRINYNRHAYRNVVLTKVSVKEDFSPVGKRPKEAEHPRPLNPVDDLPPATVITHIALVDNQLRVRGSTNDNGTVRRVVVNGLEAKATAANYAEWVIDLPPKTVVLTAHAEDAAGNVEKTPHVRNR